MNRFRKPRSATFFLGVPFLLFSIACEPQPDSKEKQAPSAKPAAIARSSAYSAEVLAALEEGGFRQSEFRQGKRQFELYCMNCHAPPRQGGGSGQRLAPPPYAVAYHYKVGFPDLKERVDAIARYTLRPDEEKALMPGALEKFGRMARIPLPEDQVRQIAIYLSIAEFEKPGWSDPH